MLKAMNHVIIYSGPSSKKANVIKVLVLGKKTKRQSISQRKARQLNQRIKACQRQIESLKRRLAKLDPNNQLGKRYFKAHQQVGEKYRRTSTADVLNTVNNFL
jgi:hypothetical protein